MSILSSIKDSMTAAVAKGVLDSKVARYGKILSLSLDSTKKSGSVTVLLSGESEPVQLDILSYTVTKSAEGACVTLTGIRTSRQWISSLAEDFILNREFPVPGWLQILL